MPVTLTPVQNSNGSTPAYGGPAVNKVQFHGGLTPTAKEAKEQIRAQQALNTTVIDKASLPDDFQVPQKKSETKKAEAKAQEEKESPEGTQVPETAEEEEVDPSQLKKLNRLAGQAREKDKQVKELQAQLAQLTQENLTAKEQTKLLADLKRTPAKVLEKIGLTPSKLAEIMIAEQTGAPIPGFDPDMEELKGKVKSFEEKQAEEEKNRTAAAQEAQKHTIINGFLGSVSSIIQQAVAKDPNAYELTLIKAKQPSTDKAFTNAASEDTFNLAQAYFHAHGEALSHEKIAEALEKHYEQEAEEEFKVLSSSKKLSAKFKLTPQEEKKVTELEKKKGSPTLGMDKAKSPPPIMPKKNYKNDKERLAAVIAWGKAHAEASGGNIFSGAQSRRK